MDFGNKVVLVTGAGSGIGEAVALHFAKLSANMSLVDKDDARLNVTADNCRQLNNGKIFKSAIDVTNDLEVKTMIQDTIHQLGGIDVVVNCAGVAAAAGLLDEDVMDIYDRVLSINLRSILVIINNAASALIERKGCIINISSVLSVLVTKNSLSYNVSKACLNQLTKCLALELASKEVRLNCVLPGFTKTNILVNAGLTQEQSDAALDHQARASPLGYLPQSGEIAEIVAFLASDKAKSMTGGCFTIDSGESLVGIPEVPNIDAALVENGS